MQLNYNLTVQFYTLLTHMTVHSSIVTLRYSVFYNCYFDTFKSIKQAVYRYSFVFFLQSNLLPVVCVTRTIGRAIRGNIILTDNLKYLL